MSLYADNKRTRKAFWSLAEANVSPKTMHCTLMANLNWNCQKSKSFLVLLYEFAKHNSFPSYDDFPSFFKLNIMMDTHNINYERLLHTLLPGPSLAGRPLEEQTHFNIMMHIHHMMENHYMMENHNMMESLHMIESHHIIIWLKVIICFQFNIMSYHHMMQSRKQKQ